MVAGHVPAGQKNPGAWVDLKFSIDIYNASETTPDQNRLRWAQLPAGWEIKPQELQVPRSEPYRRPARVSVRKSTWEHNRAHAIGQQTRWDLPCREPLPPQVRRFDQAWLWLADRINLVLTVEQRKFEIPAELLS